MNRTKLQKQLIDILLKKATGFYYYEEQEEYEKTQNKSKSREFYPHNISMFDNFVTGETKNTSRDDAIKTSNEKEKDEANTLTLVKKKITKHYIPPDMLAIKILFEINKEKVNDNDLNNLSDDELIKLKDKLIEELLNEN